jgi:NAD-dependent deacetylase
MERKKLVVLSGAGMSAESGIKTFRDADGLWEGHDVMEVASPVGWSKNRARVLEFYNIRRRQLLSVEPNDAHKRIASFEASYDVNIVTQNIDDLHERAGSNNVLHLHGELRKVRSSLDPNLIYDWDGDLREGDKCEKGSQLRPHVVWFGEEVPAIPDAAQMVSKAEILVIIGTSMQVYPAAGLVDFAPPSTPIYYIDPKPNIPYHMNMENLHVIDTSATKGVEILDKILSDSEFLD